MKKDFDFTHEEYNGDAVIKRGYDIYDEWQAKKLSSRSIVSCVESAVSLMKRKRTKAAAVEALACAFALDVRIKTKYNSILKCLFFYFSWRREVSALSALKKGLSIPENVSDIRAAIEVALQKLREKLELRKEDDEDENDARGGRKTEKAEKEADKAKEGEQEQAEDDAAKEESELDEESETEKSEDAQQKGAEEHHEQESREDQAEVIDELREEPEAAKEESYTSEQTENGLTTKQESYEQSGERIILDEPFEPSEKKDKAADTENGALDFVPFEDEHEKADRKLSFIDEVIIDNMVKGKSDVVAHNPLSDVRSEKEAAKAENMANLQNIDNIRNGKEAYLYDNMVLVDKNGVAPQQQSEKPPAPSIPQPQEQVQTAPIEEKTDLTPKVEENKDIETIQEEFESLRVPLSLDLTLEDENAMRDEICRNLTEEALLEIYRLQTDRAREHMEIESEAFEKNSIENNIVKPNESPVEKSSVIPNRK